MLHAGEQPALVPLLRLEAEDTDVGDRQAFELGRPVPPRGVNGEQRDRIARGDAGSAEHADRPRQRRSGVEGFVDHHDEPAPLRTAGESRGLRRRHPLLRMDGHRVHVLVAVGPQAGRHHRISPTVPSRNGGEGHRKPLCSAWNLGCDRAFHRKTPRRHPLQ